MLRRAILLASLLSSACSTATTPKLIVIPTVAYPFNRATLQRDDFAACADRILALAWYGRVEWERAAFLRIDDRGRFACDVWPSKLQFHSASWSGPTPDGTIAIIHSHPRTLPNPSVEDAAEARRLGIPVIVVTPQAVTMVAGRDVLSVPYEGVRAAHKR